MKDDRGKKAVDRLNKEEQNRENWKQLKSVVLLTGIIGIIILLINKFL